CGGGGRLAGEPCPGRSEEAAARRRGGRLEPRGPSARRSAGRRMTTGATDRPAALSTDLHCLARPSGPLGRACAGAPEVEAVTADVNQTTWRRTPARSR